MYIDKQAETRDDQDSRIVSMWERAVGGKPEDEELYKRWFMLNFERKNYKAAQKVSPYPRSLMKLKVEMSLTRPGCYALSEEVSGETPALFHGDC